MSEAKDKNIDAEPVIRGPRDLLKLNVNDHTEKKGRLTYLSWAWAWAEALKVDPKVNFQVQEFGGMAYMDVNGTGLVWVTVTLFDKPVTCMLPVMDNLNKPITDPNAFQVNTAIMRCMTKALALHGLGLYIYAGDDLPEDAQDDGVRPPPAPPVVDAFDMGGAVPVAQGSNAGALPLPPPWQTPPAPVEQLTPDMQLFVDAMLQYVAECHTEVGLKSFWKANQPQIDLLKKHWKPTYDALIKKFTDKKTEIAVVAQEAATILNNPGKPV